MSVLTTSVKVRTNHIKYNGIEYFRGNASLVLDAGQVDRLKEAVLGLAQADGVQQVLELCST